MVRTRTTTSTVAVTGCHREPSPMPDQVQLVFDDPDVEPVVIGQLERAFGPGRERATRQRRVRTWTAGRREVSLCAGDARLILWVEPSAA